MFFVGWPRSRPGIRHYGLRTGRRGLYSHNSFLPLHHSLIHANWRRYCVLFPIDQVWYIGISWSSWGWKHYSKGTPLRSLTTVSAVGLVFGLPGHVYKAAHVISQGYTFEILNHGRKLNQGHGEDRQWDTFILLLSYHGYLVRLYLTASNGRKADWSSKPKEDQHHQAESQKQKGEHCNLDFTRYPWSALWRAAVKWYMHEASFVPRCDRSSYYI